MGLHSRRLLFSSAALLLLLFALAGLQYHWIEQLSRAEHERIEAMLRSAGAGFARDFDGEIARVFLSFHDPSDPRRVARQYEAWMADAEHADLVRDVFFVAGRTRALSTYDAAEGAFVPVDWPEELERMRSRFGDGAGPGPIDESVPALIVRPRHRRSIRERHPPDHVIVRLDPEYITGTLLPELAERHLGERSAAVYESDRLIYGSSALSGDASFPMFSLRRMRRPPPPPGAPGRFGGGWRLVVKHRAGSLEAAVAGLRRHNLMMSAGVIGLLMASLAMVVVAAQRAQRLARQQIEFVAGVSHELHTPISAILAAGENLSDGVVEDPEQVGRYGALIQREGRRLSSMVHGVLDFASSHSATRNQRRRPVGTAEIVDEALAACRFVLEEHGVQVERDVPEDLPRVEADREELVRALQNLVENAVKYGGEARWVGLRATTVRGGVELTVEDRGQGIRREELGRIFDPFYRGEHTASARVPGSGLGLSLVKRIVEDHGGSVRAASGGPGRGSRFTIHLPAKATA